MELEPTADGCFNDVFKMRQVGQEPLKPCSSGANPPPPAGCFDCNICLDYATDPVVTLCGHLYCWPCIYRWLQLETTSARCPVCKASLSEDTLVPLYGRGHSTPAAKGSQQTLKIPNRPSAQRDTHRIEDLYTYRPPSVQWQRQHHHNHHHHHYYPYYNSYMPAGQPLPTRVLHSTAGGALGGIAALLLPWAFRNQQGTSMYNSSPYHLMTGGSYPRLRRHEMQIERSLHQMWVFLLCCALLCLLLF